MQSQTHCTSHAWSKKLCINAVSPYKLVTQSVFAANRALPCRPVGPAVKSCDECLDTRRSMIRSLSKHKLAQQIFLYKYANPAVMLTDDTARVTTLTNRSTHLKAANCAPYSLICTVDLYFSHYNPL